MIISNIGGGGNHLRLLCLLDKNFNLEKITQKSKLDFMLDEVYSDDRDWHNWLEREWKYREVLDDQILFRHPEESEMADIINNDEINPILYLIRDPQSCYRHYLKFNSNLNIKSKEQFLKDDDNNSLVMNYISKKKQKVKVMQGDFLSNPKLQDEKIAEINRFFKIDIDINQAQQVHKKWYNLNRKAEKNIVKDIAKIYEEV